jgi:dual specificity protein kinase YAK1
MESQWQHHSDPANRHGRYSQLTSQHPSREPSSGSAPQQPPPSGFSYEPYQTPSVPSHPHSIAASPTESPHARPYNNGGDVTMEDADPYNRMKYPSRPNHQHRVSGQYLSQEDSTAARRYSPMKALSPSSPYATSPHQQNQPLYASYPSQNTSARQSPTRPHMYSSQSQSYYSSPSKSSILSTMHACQGTTTDVFRLASTRQQQLQLPPIQPGDTSPDQFYPASATAQLNAVFGREVRSSRNLRHPLSAGTADRPRGPVPRFKKVENVKDLEPRINPQPAFRRANPEGGFISVSFPCYANPNAL